MSRPDHIVITSIAAPPLLGELRDHLARFDRLNEVTVWFVADHKTPAAAATLCDAMHDAGLDVRYLDIAAQDAWGREHAGDFYPRLPYNNESRRNIGYLRALADGCERLIVMDDDNFPTDEDLIDGHRAVGAAIDEPIVNEPAGYHNVCESLVIDPARPIFPRGFPFRRRGLANTNQTTQAPPGARVGVNAGLWLGEPDIDATTWLNGAVRSVGYRGRGRLVLDQRTWSPINTQNTAVARELIPAFCCIPMGATLPGGRVERYGDIWAGYFLQAVLTGTPWHVAFGRPLVDHRRNPHDYLADLRHEYWGMLLTDWLLDQLRERFTPTAGSIVDRVRELSEFIERAADDLPRDYPDEVAAFVRDTAQTQRCWAAACEQLDGKRYESSDPRPFRAAARRDRLGPAAGDAAEAAA